MFCFIWKLSSKFPLNAIERKQQLTKSLGYCVASLFLDELSRNLALNYSFFGAYIFPAIFIQENIATTNNDNDTEQNVSMNPVNLEEEGNISKSLLLVLNAMQENLTSSNSILRNIVQRKLKSTKPDSIYKRAKCDESRSCLSVNASEKALVSTSKEVIDNASEEANTKTPDGDTLSLLGDDSHHDFCSEDEEVNNDDLLSQITTSLSSAKDTGPLVSDKLSKLVNDKFQTEYTVEK